MDRVVHPEQTVAKVQKYFDEFGITRIAEQTKLDRIGIPCFASFRPNAKTLATSQGKGLTREAARASAVMEAIETAVAENPPVDVIQADSATLLEEGWELVDVSPQLPVGETLSETKKLRWAKGINLRSQSPAAIPLCAIDLDHDNQDVPNISKCSNGLASGNVVSEAIFHGLCELIERDALTLKSFAGIGQFEKDAIDPQTWTNDEVKRLLEMIDQSGLTVRLFDQTSDNGVPCVFALIGQSGNKASSHFDLAAGFGAHPNSDRAAIRAITEAAQTRTTSIAASRDDILPSTYEQSLDGFHAELIEVTPQSSRGIESGKPMDVPVQEQLSTTLNLAMGVRGGGDIYAFPLSAHNPDYSVVRVVAPFMEDRSVNDNWRPQMRALVEILNQ